MRATLDLFWPPVCPGCRNGLEPGHDGLLCADCRLHLPLIRGNACQRCGTPLGPFEDAHGGNWCADCGRHNLVFTRAVAAGVYDGPLAEVIKLYKYGYYARNAYLSGFLAGLLADRLVEPDCPVKPAEVEVFLPVPSHPSRVRARGFNSTLLLARKLARRLRLPLEQRNLVKTRPTPQQAGQERAGRLENVKDSFAVRFPERIRD